MKVTNVGLGPAIINSCQLYVDKQQVQMNDMKIQEAALLPVIALPIGQVYQLRTFTFQTRTGLPSQAAITFLDLGVDVGSDAEFHELDNRIRSRARFVIGYESAYGEKQTFDSDTY